MTGTVFLISWAVAAVGMAGLWLSPLARRNAGIVDVVWAFGTGAVGLCVVFLTPGGHLARQMLVAAVVVAWSVRLGVHLAGRVLGEPEDGRYRHMREALGKHERPGMFAFFQLQATWTVLFAVPMWAAARADRPLDWLDGLGVAIFAASIAGETIADRQLARFRGDPGNAGGICRVGLWRFSRHPNYFFEWVHWFAYVAIGWGSPHWWVTLLGLAVMYVFLAHLTGIPFTEQQSLRTRGDAYRAYQATTSRFFPWPPKPGAATTLGTDRS